jgi:hypothetical protein
MAVYLESWLSRTAEDIHGTPRGCFFWLSLVLPVVGLISVIRDIALMRW